MRMPAWDCLWGLAYAHDASIIRSDMRPKAPPATTGLFVFYDLIRSSKEGLPP